MFKRNRYLNCNRDPRWIKAKYAGQCHTCKAMVKVGEDVYYYPATRSLCCASCGEVESAQFRAAVEDERAYNSQY